MTTTDIPDIIATIAECKDFDNFEQIRKAVDAKTEQFKASLIAQAGAMGLACRDGNGKKPRRKSKQHHED